MGIQNCVHRLQNYSVTLEMIEGYSFVSTGFWCKFFFSFFVFKFLIVLIVFLKDNSFDFCFFVLLFLI